MELWEIELRDRCRWLDKHMIAEMLIERETKLRLLQNEYDELTALVETMLQTCDALIKRHTDRARVGVALNDNAS